MKGTRARGLVTATAALVAAMAAAMAPVGSASAEGHEANFTATVDQVLVNRYGGITVNGTLDCSAQVAAAYGGEENIPDNTTVLVSVNWQAKQYIGRNKVVRASYEPAIAQPCFNNDEAFPVGTVAPWSWATRYGYPVGDIQWVYSDTGKFTTGPIHVELQAYGISFDVGEDSYLFTNFSGWDLRATKVR